MLGAGLALLHQSSHELGRMTLKRKGAWRNSFGKATTKALPGLYGAAKAEPAACIQRRSEGTMSEQKNIPRWDPYAPCFGINAMNSRADSGSSLATD